MKKALCTAVIFIMLAVTGCQSGGLAPIENPITVTASIECKTILDNLDIADDKVKKALPSDGVLLEATDFQAEDGESVFLFLQRVAEEKNLELMASGGNGNAYLQAINEFSEFSVGAASGWQYFVNGEYINKSIGAYTLKDGDAVEFKFTCSLGADLVEK